MKALLLMALLHAGAPGLQQRTEGCAAAVLTDFSYPKSPQVLVLQPQRVAALKGKVTASQSQRPGAKASPDFDGLSRKGFAAADGAAVDPATKLPTRIVHKASGVRFVLVPAGEFLMGSPADEAGHEGIERQHRRVVRRPFYIGEYEVTVGQFRRFVAATKYRTDAERGVQENDRTGSGAFASMPDGDREWHAAASWHNPFPYLRDYCVEDGHPVVQVSWNDARRFAEHFGMRLPTEAQWEYAARAGSKTRFFWGEAEAGGRGYGNVQDASGRKRFSRWNTSFSFDDGVAILAPVGQYRPNAWGIYDVVGNVAEWTEDAYRRDYPADGADEAAAQGGANAARVIRGGSYLDSPDFQRSAKRIVFSPVGRRDFVGFRVAFDAVGL